MKSFRETLGLEDQEPIGRGGEKTVYDDPRNPDRVIAIRKDPETGEHVRAMFYLRKILHFLMPQNIPDVSLESPEVSILEKRTRNAGHLARQSLKSPRLKSQHEERSLTLAVDKFHKEMVKDPGRKELKRKLSELGIYIDSSTSNFSRSDEGDIQYLDSFFDSETNIAKLREAVEMKRDLPDYNGALVYLERLEKATKREPEARKEAA